MVTNHKSISELVAHEYVAVLECLQSVSAAYGTQSPVEYLTKYAPRICAQIQTLYQLIVDRNLAGGRLLSIGGWPGVSGIVLHRLTGISVTLVDHPAVLVDEYYDFYRENNLETVAFDCAETISEEIPVEKNYDIIECCQCIEHWNFNPIFAFRDIFNRILKESGFMFVTVPNAVCLYRRLFTAFGQNPFPAIKDFIDEANGVPGAEVSPHWREYTKQDLMRLIEASGGACVNVNMKQYALHYPMSLAQKVHQSLHRVHPSLHANIEVVATRRG